MNERYEKMGSTNENVQNINTIADSCSANDTRMFNSGFQLLEDTK